ncbi:type II toxin-antitoxin system VapC family toxin [Limnohabitans sp. G3-2]|uniref:type II toxin-antitoxin system tRNA(fMet)-specific endonuclease VapC n=1 Tax=Limnohabitans sp. G3-2 TaxID=1100711 RepID=UPI000C1DD57C|nr:type II toxin-antitoxin system VapC family toxin [Limnohabitans sp. G3-2]PIT73496.1 VapC toxin family PIN domain ribonuclease [Limnohabitans sp. G3-2]
MGAQRYLLDTNICIYIAKGQPLAVRHRFEKQPLQTLAMSTITVGELRFGAEKSQFRDRALATLDQLVQMIRPSALPMAAAEHYGNIRAILQRQGLPIGNNDLWLAAHALAEDWTLVTNNTREFERVPGLRVENWALAD